jgi:hypothetical protein
MKNTINKDALFEDVWHLDLFLKMDDVQIAFGIPNSLFHVTTIIFFMMHTFHLHLHWVHYYFWLFLPLNVWCFLGLRFFDSLERLSTHKQDSLPITFGAMELILTITIAPTTYLGSWVIIISVIDVRFWLINVLSFLKP